MFFEIITELNEFQSLKQQSTKKQIDDEFKIEKLEQRWENRQTEFSALEEHKKLLEAKVSELENVVLKSEEQQASYRNEIATLTNARDELQHLLQ